MLNVNYDHQGRQNPSDNDAYERIIDTSIVDNADEEDTLMFDENDEIYEEFISDEDIPNILKWLTQNMKIVSSMIILCGSLISVASLGVLYLDLHILQVCVSTKWEKLTDKIQQVRIISSCVVDVLLQLWYIFLLYFMFPKTDICKLNLILINLLAGCIDSIYRLSAQTMHVYGFKGWYIAPQILMLVFTTLYSSWRVASLYRNGIRARFKFCFVLNIQVFLSLIIGTTHQLVTPSFVQLEGKNKLIIASIIPLIGYLCRFICRKTADSITNLIHPGKLYLFSTTVYTVSILFYRSFQATIESFTLFILLSLIHAVIGLLERITLICRERFYNRIRTKFTGWHYNTTHLPKSKRVLTDLLIIGIIYEIWGVIITNALLMLYAIQKKKFL